MPQFKVGVASVVVDGLLAQKDRLALLSYQNTMTPNSRFDNMASMKRLFHFNHCRDWFYADNALKNSNVKWKN